MVNRSSVCISPSSSFWTVETLVPQLPSTFPVLQLHRGALFRINTAEWPVLSRPDASLDAKRVNDHVAVSKMVAIKQKLPDFPVEYFVKVNQAPGENVHA